jgi:hypothetical protein
MLGARAIAVSRRSTLTGSGHPSMAGIGGSAETDGRIAAG